MPHLTLVLPILPGKLEAVKQACAMAFGVRRGEYEQSRQRLGITSETLWLAAQGNFLFWLLETGDPREVLSRLGASDLSFDRWFIRHVREAHGLDLSHWPAAADEQFEQIFVWHRD